MYVRLYHFINQQYGIEAILKRRLKISRITELNDPFEVLGLRLKSKQDRLVWEKTKRDLSVGHGLICMSGGWSNPLLWSHYADRHRGICLGFDVTDSYFEAVNYRDTRISFEELGVTSLKELTSDHMRLILHSKFKHWEYEGEHRAFTDFDDVDPKSGLAFMPFSSNLLLREIIVGVSCDLGRQDLEVLLKQYPQKIECKKARLAFKSFSVTEQKNSKMWR